VFINFKHVTDLMSFTVTHINSKL